MVVGYTRFMDKAGKLSAIAKLIATCRECKVGKSGLPVPGEGNPDARVVFLGEAPGKTEAATGRPFVGRSGKLLRTFIREAGFTEEEVYITSPVKYLPDRGTPTKKDIKHGKVHLAKQLAVIQPSYVVLMGATAVYAMFERTMPIMKVHGSVIKENGLTFIVMLHPAAVLRFPKYAPLMKEDFRKLAALVS